MVRWRRIGRNQSGLSLHTKSSNAEIAPLRFRKSSIKRCRDSNALRARRHASHHLALRRGEFCLFLGCRQQYAKDTRRCETDVLPILAPIFFVSGHIERCRKAGRSSACARRICSRHLKLSVPTTLITSNSSPEWNLLPNPCAIKFIATQGHLTP